LWGAKGATAEHVYLQGVCREAIPGERREGYPGTEADYIDEQRRLFYVSITRTKKTLVLSRALEVKRGPARQMGVKLTSGGPYWARSAFPVGALGARSDAPSTSTLPTERLQISTPSSAPCRLTTHRTPTS
jgi:superfamily I DNA/RNA helicase